MTIPDGQAEVAALLRRVTGAEPVETHVSAVFVGREDAFKLKKAVRLAFLDFTALADRERFLRRELELNQPHAPALYRDVMPIRRRADGSLGLGGEGEVVDWVLRMAPLPKEAFLDEVAGAGGLTPALLDAVADAAVALHRAAPRAPAGFDAPAAMRRVLAGNVQSCRDAGLDPARVAALAERMGARIAALASRLQARAEAGFVRRCHGDLHLGNLCIVEGRPVPFDALEFDERLAVIDTGYDLAFLLMDLDVRCGRAAANRVMNRAVARSGDAGMLAGLPLWLSLRAMVRAHVEATRGRDGVAYLAAAEAYLQTPPPRLLAFGGLQGTGKTRLARILAPDLGAAPGALVLRTDETRKRRAGIAPEDRLPQSAYAESESQAVHEEIFAMAREALSGGHCVILDAVFLDPRQREGAEAAAREAGVSFTGFWLEAPLDVLRSRVAARQGDASDATVAVLERAARADAGAISWIRLDAAGEPADAARGALALQRRLPA